MNDLVRFLLARIEDDEAVAKKLSRERARNGRTGPDGALSLERLRAECVAKRELIGTLQQLFVLRDQPLEKPVRDAAAQMLQTLAVPYADHSAYRDTWGKATVS
jgi:Family of unknown function (DUF6221)